MAPFRTVAAGRDHGGSDDKIVDCDSQAGRLQTVLADSKLVKVPGTGHMLYYSVPEQVAAVIREVVQEGLAAAGENLARAAE